MKKLIAYCGLDCEKCDAYIATKNNNDESREKIAELWSRLNNVPITASMINCEGCRVDGKKTPFCESMCEIRLCALKRTVNTCGDCSKLSDCEKIKMIHNSNEDAKKNLME